MFTQYDDNGNVQMVQEPSADYIYTYADYLEWQWEERVELLKGVVMRMAAPNTKHQTVAGNFYFVLKGFINNFPCKVFMLRLMFAFLLGTKEKMMKSIRLYSQIYVLFAIIQR